MRSGVGGAQSLTSLKTIHPDASKPAVNKVTYGIKALILRGTPLQRRIPGHGGGGLES